VLGAARAGALDLPAFLERHVSVVRDVARGRWDAAAAGDAADWESRGSYAAAHHVAHFLLRRIEVAGEQDRFPAAWLDGLRAEVARRAAAAAQLPGALAEAADALAGAGLDYLVLKGSPFAVRYFGDPAARRSVDIDLLVKLADVDAALRVLVARGFLPKRRRTRGAGAGLRVRRRCLRTEHALGLDRGDVSIDLHWRLRTAPAYRVDERAVWADPLEIRVGDRSYPAPSDEYALVALLLGIAHDIGRRGCRVKHVLDADRLLRALPADTDWPAFLDRRRAENTLSVAVNVLDLVRALFAAPGEFPALAAALDAHAAVRVPASTADAALLAHGLAGAWAHARWFTRVYPVAWARDAVWLVDRKLAGARSVPQLVYRAGAAGYWAIRNRFAQRAWRRG
jgi:hypothetical protein